jgi:hypothetical protein
LVAPHVTEVIENLQVKPVQLIQFLEQAQITPSCLQTLH